MAVRTGIPPQYLAEDTEMLRYIVAVIDRADKQKA